MLRKLRAVQALPDDFLFGVGNSDHQVEAYDPPVEDINDLWERRRLLTLRGKATDFWNRYPEDIALAKAMGCKMFRFSVAWSRVEPSIGTYDDDAFDHYRQVVAAIRDAGMEVMLTLHHFTWPIHVEERGGMLADDFPAIFARYAAEVVQRIGADVRYWITFNEPNLLPVGYTKAWWETDYRRPPGLPVDASFGEQNAAVSTLLRNLFLAHTAARAVIRQHAPDARVTANAAVLGMPDWLQRFVDRNITRMRGPDNLAKQNRRYAERVVLERGDVDVILATLTRTPEREEVVDFSEVYYVAGQALLVPVASAVDGVASLNGQVVVAVSTSTAASAMRTLIPLARSRTVGDYAAALKELDSGNAAALLADDTILLGLMKQHPGRYRLASAKLTAEPYAAAVTKGNPELLGEVDTAIRLFKQSDAWVRSFTTHFPDQPPVSVPPIKRKEHLADVGGIVEPPVPVVAPDAPVVPQGPLAGPQAAVAAMQQFWKRTLLQRIRHRGRLIVGVKEDVPGFGYRDPRTGEWSGLEIDLARFIAQHILGDPDNIEFRPVKTRERISALQSLLRFLDPVLRFWTVITTFGTTNWWYLGMAGQLPEFICPSSCVGQFDFVGFDYYWGFSSLRLGHLQGLGASLLSGRFDKAPVWPNALYAILKRYAALFPDKELMVVENGSVANASGVTRADYLRKHMREIQRARADGVNITGYICWSITSNREWGSEFHESSDFGLFFIDLDRDSDLKRVETEASAAYQQIIAQRGA